MSQQPYTHRLIEDYLLGSLSDEEVERLDELSFTDPSFADALAAAEGDLVDAYVQNELTSEQLERFKSHYLISPLRRHRTEFADALKTILARESKASSPQSVLHSATKQSFPMSMFASRSLARWALVAGVVALVCISVWLGIQNARLRQQAASTESQLHELQRREQELLKAKREQSPANSEQPPQKTEDVARSTENEKQQSNEPPQRKSLRQPVKPAIASFILAPQMRNVSEVPVVSLPRDTSHVQMTLKLEPNDYRSYRVALVDPDTNQVLWRSGKLVRPKSPNDTVGVSFRVVLLKPKNYILRLFGTSAEGGSEFITQYPFKVVEQ
jgi:hypothetical protein